MDFSPMSRRSRKPPPPPPNNSDLYSTVVIHEKDDAASREPDTGSSDLYATMVYKDGVVEDEEESLPPLLKHLPKDFGGGEDMEDFDDDESAAASISGTMIVKTDRRRSNFSDRSSNVSSSYVKPQSASGTPIWEKRSPISRIVDGEEDNTGDFSTFVVKDSGDEDIREKEEKEENEGMGTMVRRGGGSEGGGTMRRAVESMQKVGEVGAMGYGRRRKTSGGGVGSGSESSIGSGIAHLRHHGSGKVSSSSIPECMTREDPFTKYELLDELGKYSKFNF